MGDSDGSRSPASYAPAGNLEPDLFVLPARAEAQGEIRKQYSTGPASLVIEILSESTRIYDLEHKAILYREDGPVRSGWSMAAAGSCWWSGEDGEGYHASRIEDGPYQSSAIPGFWIDVSWLWADPLPDCRRCLEKILAGPPA